MDQDQGRAVSQLSRIIRNPPERSTDEQTAAPDDRGSYGELMEEIDRLLQTPAATRPSDLTARDHP